MFDISYLKSLDLSFFRSSLVGFLFGLISSAFGTSLALGVDEEQNPKERASRVIASSVKSFFIKVS
jgi:hypothetical protein